jgi:hypothetical protein
MSITGQSKPSGKPGPRNRKGDQRRQKGDQQPSPKPDQQPDASEQIDVAVAPTDASPIGAVAATDTPPIGAVALVDAPPIGAVALADASPIGAVAPADNVSISIQTIANAYKDYTKKSFEETRSFVEKLTSVRSLDKAIEIQAEFAKQAYETFVAETQKICQLYSEFAKQIFKPLEGFVSKATQTGR